ncbi:hypothetical protein Plhal703r1_c01g0005331 [Plasmopara halstedii]
MMGVKNGGHELLSRLFLFTLSCFSLVRFKVYFHRRAQSITLNENAIYISSASVEIDSVPSRLPPTNSENETLASEASNTSRYYAHIF